MPSGWCGVSNASDNAGKPRVRRWWEAVETKHTAAGEMTTIQLSSLVDVPLLQKNGNKALQRPWP